MVKIQPKFHFNGDEAAATKNGGGLIDAQAFGVLHNQYRERLVNSMTGIVRDRDQAEDITAAAFAKALEKLESFRGESSLYTWIHAIALNEARQSLSRNQAVSLDSIPVQPKELSEPDRVADALKRSECRGKLRKAPRQIPAVYRRTLDHFVRGFSVKRISRQNRIPVGTVLSRIFAAKRLLRAAWEA